MKIYEAQNRTRSLLEVLLDVWERSVRATHLFLSDAEVRRIKEYVPQALEGVENLVVAEAEPEHGSVAGKPIAFMGTQDGRLEMLFVAPEERGHGVGKRLLKLGFDDYGIVEVTVNEQNPQAVGFYEHMGFATYKRTDVDEEGGPYPLLYMRRAM